MLVLWIRSIARLRLGWHGLHPNAWYPQDKLRYSTKFYFQLGNKGLTPATRARTHTQTHAGFTNEWGDEELTTCQNNRSYASWFSACLLMSANYAIRARAPFISRGDQCLNMDIASWHLCHDGDCDWPLRQMSCPWACTPNPDRWDQVGQAIDESHAKFQNSGHRNGWDNLALQTAAIFTTFYSFCI